MTEAKQTKKLKTAAAIDAPGIYERQTKYSLVIRRVTAAIRTLRELIEGHGLSAAMRWPGGRSKPAWYRS